MIKDAEKITRIKLHIQRMYSLYNVMKCIAPEKIFTDLKELNIDAKIKAQFICSEGKSIVQYAIEARVNTMKELLVYTSLSLEEICKQLQYASIAEMESELFNQTGLTIPFFTNLKHVKASLAQKAADKQTLKNQIIQ